MVSELVWRSTITVCKIIIYFYGTNSIESKLPRKCQFNPHNKTKRQCCNAKSGLWVHFCIETSCGYAENRTDKLVRTTSYHT